jgi:hypothetical protein
MDITRSGWQPSAEALGDYFTGKVRIATPFKDSGTCPAPPSRSKAG